MNPQSELLILIGMYVFIGFFFASLYKKDRLKTQFTFLSAGVLGYLLTKDLIFNYMVQEIQLWLSRTYLVLAFASVLHFFIPGKGEVMYDAQDYEQLVNLTVQIETKHEQQNIEFETILNEKHNMRDTTLGSLIGDADRLLKEKQQSHQPKQTKDLIREIDDFFEGNT